MVACVLLMLVHRLRTGKFKTMHVVTAAVALVLGTATLLLHDKRFIQWKPTVLLGAHRGRFPRQHVHRQAAAGAAHARGGVR